MFYLTWAVTVLVLGFNVPPHHSAGQGILAHQYAMCLSLDLCISYSEISHCTCCVNTNQTLNGVVCFFECDVKKNEVDEKSRSIYKQILCNTAMTMVVVVVIIMTKR